MCPRVSSPSRRSSRQQQVARARRGRAGLLPSRAPKKNLAGIPVLTLCAGQIESNYDEVTDSFDNMNLKPELLRGVYAYGFERPSAIQQRAIMPVIKGKFASSHTTPSNTVTTTWG